MSRQPSKNRQKTMKCRQNPSKTLPPATWIGRRGWQSAPDVGGDKDFAPDGAFGRRATVSAGPVAAGGWAEAVKNILRLGFANVLRLNPARRGTQSRSNRNAVAAFGPALTQTVDECFTLALTPALSPRRGNSLRTCSDGSMTIQPIPSHIFERRGECFPLSSGERVRVREDVTPCHSLQR